METRHRVTPVLAARIVQKKRQAVLSCVTRVIAEYSKSTPRGSNIPRPLFSFVCYIQGISDSTFQRMYRMPKSVFFTLAEALNRRRHTLSNKSPSTSPLLRLSPTLRRLAGGSYLDIANAHRVASSSFYYHVNRTLKELDKNLVIKFPYRDKEWLANESKGFSRDGRSPINGCSAALDGIAIKIQEPSRLDGDNSSMYYNRKGVFANNVQAACDSKYRFVFVSGLAAGSSHDSTAFGMSCLSELLQRDSDGLLLGYWIAGDNAYVATLRLLTTWPGRKLPRGKDCFNYWLSSARIHIEQAFGILVARWGILWRHLRLSAANAASLVVILCKLHNYIIDMTGTVHVPPHIHIDSAADIEEADNRVYLQDECDRDDTLHRRRRDLENCSVRQRLTDEIRDAGLKRPDIY